MADRGLLKFMELCKKRGLEQVIAAVMTSLNGAKETVAFQSHFLPRPRRQTGKDKGGGS